MRYTNRSNILPLTIFVNTTWCNRNVQKTMPALAIKSASRQYKERFSLSKDKIQRVSLLLVQNFWERSNNASQTDCRLSARLPIAGSYSFSRNRSWILMKFAVKSKTAQKKNFLGQGYFLSLLYNQQEEKWFKLSSRALQLVRLSHSEVCVQ